MVSIIKQVKRVFPDSIASLILIAGLFLGIHEKLPPSLQLVFFKMVLTSVAFLHAHIAGKLAFGIADWSCKEFTPQKVLRVALYVVFIISYSMGG